jgi:SAM-dependent methyltransferase
MIMSILRGAARLKVFGKSPVGAYLRLNRWIWSYLPSFLTSAGSTNSYGCFLHTLARLQGNRKQSFGTFFLRNRPELDLICRVAALKGNGSTLGMSVLACSVGAEVYSILWKIRSARPDLKVITQAVDVSKEVLEFARKGVYSLKGSEVHDTSIFERMSDLEMKEMFDRDGDMMKIRAWIKEGISWHFGDAGDPELIDSLGPQDVVVANRFLCHMDPADAERCLRTVARLVRPGGYLFVSGVDLDVRAKVARDLHWKPILDLMEEIHDGDPCLRGHWPWDYTGLEPLNKRREDWEVRYAAVFQLGIKS